MGAAAQFHSDATTTELSVNAGDTQKFQINAGGTTIECTDLDLASSTQSSKTTTTLTISPEYFFCEELFGQEVRINENECDYVFHLNSSSTEGSMDIECPTSTGIQLRVENLCSWEIDSQTGLSKVKYATKSPSTASEIEVQPEVSSISSLRTTSHFPFLCAAGSKEGTLTGNSLLTGSAGSHVNLSVD